MISHGKAVSVKSQACVPPLPRPSHSHSEQWKWKIIFYPNLGNNEEVIYQEKKKDASEPIGPWQYALHLLFAYH